MWPAIVGLLALSLVVVLFGMLSAHSSRARRVRIDATAAPTHLPKHEPRRGNNSENPDAMAMATGTRTNKAEPESGEYGGS
jgi:hypothetical protein